MDSDSGRSSSLYPHPRTLLGASALVIRDRHDHLLIVKPLYKDVWHLPGGLMEQDEFPRAAAERETKEEIGLELSAGRMLVIDFKSPNAERPACVQFIFDGGVVDSEQLKGIVLQANEIESWRAVPRDEAVALVAQDGPSSRLARALTALDSGIPAYLEDGQLV